MKRSISQLIKEALLQRGHRSIRIDDGNIFLSLVTGIGKDGKPHPGDVGWRVFWFGLLVCTVFGALTFIIYAATFFIKDILLFDEKPIVTETGAIIPQRSCNREQVLFHFNSADLWARTGVQLQRGDRIRISHSGGFHSDVADIYLKARQNGKLKYSYYFNSCKPSREGVGNCIYHTRNDVPAWRWLQPWRSEEFREREPAFGSILWQVADENCVFEYREQDIHQIGRADADRFIRIRRDGELFLTVNDIYLTDEVIGRLNIDRKAEIERFESLFAECTPSDTLFARKALWARNHDLEIVGIHEKGRNALYYETDSIRRYIEDNPQMRSIWFEDNIGSVLICVEIERKVKFIHLFTRWFRNTERRINWACDNHGWAATLCLSTVACLVSVILFCWPFVIAWMIYRIPKFRKGYRYVRSGTLSRVARQKVERQWNQRQEYSDKCKQALKDWWDDIPPEQRASRRKS